MKFEIFDEQVADEPPPVRLRLVRAGTSIVLQAVDKDGNVVADGNLLWFNSDGIWRATSVSPALGLPLDSSGRLVFQV